MENSDKMQRYFFASLVSICFHCTEDGQWSAWTRWFECNVTCGGGLRGRHRTCTVAKHGGSDCEGETGQWQTCAQNPCPSEYL